MLAHEKQILEYEETIAKLKMNQDKGLWTDEEIVKLEEKLESLKNKVYTELSPWERVAICRHPGRPRSIDYIKAIVKDFVEIAGDRLFRDDKAIIAGLGMIGDMKCMIVAQEKGCDTESRLERNFGMPHPEGYRKAMRAMRLAAKFKLPVVCLLDTPGAYPGLSAEERGQGSAIAHNLLEMSRLPTLIIIILIGEGCSGGALGMGVGDVIGMLEHAYYSVISPEGCASILWKDPSKNAVAAEGLKMHVEDLLELGIVDEKIEEPRGGAHHDPAVVFRNTQEFILRHWDRLKGLKVANLIEERYQKFRKMGKFEIKDT